MTHRWGRRLRRREPVTPDEASVAEATEGSQPERGPRVLLESSDGGRRSLEIVGALAKRYEITPFGEGGQCFEVTVDDAVFSDEAVVRLASVLDQIDRDWQLYVEWPKAQ